MKNRSAEDTQLSSGRYHCDAGRSSGYENSSDVSELLESECCGPRSTLLGIARQTGSDTFALLPP